MTPQVAVPWRATSDRLPAFERCCAFWAEHGFEVVTADSDPALPFLCNQSRNRAVARTDTDIVILADGDTLPADIGQISDAIEIVTAHPDTVVWPYTTYVYLTPEAVHVPDLATAEVVAEIPDMSMGIIVIAKATYHRLGGYDEDFTPGCWGFDDLAFHHCAEALTATVRLPGKVYSFEHEAHRDCSEENPNRQRFDSVYLPAIGNSEMMRKVVDENLRRRGMPQ